MPIGFRHSGHPKASGWQAAGRYRPRQGAALHAVLPARGVHPRTPPRQRWVTKPATSFKTQKVLPETGSSSWPELLSDSSPDIGGEHVE